MIDWKLRLFVNVVNIRTEAEGLTAEEVLADYPNLTDTEKTEILNAIK